MKTFKTVKKTIIDRAKKLNACHSQLQRVEESETIETIILVCRDNAGWCRDNNLFTDEESILFFGVSMSNLFNSGNSNSGDRNSGDRNSGDSNSGDRNSGYSNSGYSNSGDRNSGDSNSGDSNSGYRNSGDWNSGDRNSGDSNSGYRNSGAFCTDPSPIMILFNKPCKSMTVKDWEQTRAYNLMVRINNTFWVQDSVMTPQEKAKYPKWETTGGYLKTIPLKEAWANFWGNLNESDRKEFTSLENFDSEIFFEITGVRV